MGTIHGSLILPQVKTCVWWGQLPPELGNGRGGQAPETFFLCLDQHQLPCNISAWGIWWHQSYPRVPTLTWSTGGFAGTCSICVSVSAHWDLCLSLPTGIFHPTSATGSHLLQCLAELLLLTSSSRAGMPVLYQPLPWHGWGRCPSSHAPDGAAGVFVPCNITQHLQEQP